MFHSLAHNIILKLLKDIYSTTALVGVKGRVDREIQQELHDCTDVVVCTKSIIRE